MRGPPRRILSQSFPNEGLFFSDSAVPKSQSGELLKKTAACWKSHYPESLSDQDLEEIIANMVGFFTILSDWDHRNGEASSANSNGRDGAI